MKNVRKFSLEEDYKIARNDGDIIYPSVSLTEDTEKAWIKPYENYIIATYNITDVNDDVLTYNYYSDFPSIYPILVGLNSNDRNVSTI
jgi:hypothetical protein